jgi:hypothetical protein
MKKYIISIAVILLSVVIFFAYRQYSIKQNIVDEGFKECSSFIGPTIITPVLKKDDKFIMPHYDFTLNKCHSAKIINTDIVIEYSGQDYIPGWEGGKGPIFKIEGTGDYDIWPSGYNEKEGVTFTVSKKDNNI